MATSYTKWKAVDNREFDSEQAALDHEAAVKTRIETWLETNLGSYVAEGDRANVAAFILTNFLSFLDAVEAEE